MPRTVARPLSALALAASLAACASSPPRGGEEGAFLVVQAIDGTGAPLKDADVRVVTSADLRRPEAVVAGRVTGDVVATVHAMAAAVGRTDRLGMARLAWPEGDSLLIAVERDARYGQIELPASEISRSEPLTVTAPLRLEQYVTIDAEDGGPLGGVQISAAVRGEGDAIEILPVTAVTDSSGRADLRVPKGAFGQRVPLVVARIATRERVIGPWRTGAVARLTAPPTAEAHLAPIPDPAGGTLHALVQVFAESDGSRSTATLAHRVGPEGGLIGRVERGIDLRAVALLSRGDGADQLLLGRFEWTIKAREVGQPIHMPLETDAVLVEGRVTDAAGAALGGVAVQIDLPGRPRTEWSSTTDGEGRFAYLVPRRVARDAQLRVRASGDREGSAALTANPMPYVDLGDVAVVPAR